MKVNYQETIDSLPKEFVQPNSLEKIQRLNSQSERTLVILDDDPTGTQTVHGVDIITTWEVGLLQGLFEAKSPIFFILTNSRSLQEPEATALAEEIGANLKKASEAAKRKIMVVSRGDSTLRGHYPAEVDAMSEALGIERAITVLIPAFFEGGRFTINNTHWVKEGEELIPASETPFAQDAAFGYKNAELTKWVEEKSKGKIKAADVESISLDDLRLVPEKLVEQLISMNNGATCVVNAAAYSDLENIVIAIIKAEKEGKKFTFRTAASIVPVLAGIERKPPLVRNDFTFKNENGGIVIVGSYVPKTSAQLEKLKELESLSFKEVDVNRLLESDSAHYISKLIAELDEKISYGQTVVIYTSRLLVKGNDGASSLNIGNKISESLVAIVKGLKSQPKFVLAKGGITSSDTATKGLGIKKAKAIGQILPGVPVWEQGAEAKYPGVPYVVFPGNVGDDNAVATAIKKLI
ncbi:four-carbon acid sugar kinase family protein [Flammeovirgaceae bacterium SG7u.111]|nr:four-carbon acid sugar kinase family protein [Flammeovirgaceae bacterium SG7u.132]WPO37548.1 four-carbon acid sugar kinase family protein [Flammeovirgaceae bacterium SG7u.111]